MGDSPSPDESLPIIVELIGIGIGQSLLQILKVKVVVVQIEQAQRAQALTLIGIVLKTGIALTHRGTPGPIGQLCYRSRPFTKEKLHQLISLYCVFFDRSRHTR